MHTRLPSPFTTAAELLMQLIEAKKTGALQGTFRSFGRVDLLLIDELGYIPFEREATSILFNVISARYEQSSIALTSNLRNCGSAQSISATKAVAKIAVNECGIASKRNAFSAVKMRRGLFGLVRCVTKRAPQGVRVPDTGRSL